MFDKDWPVNSDISVHLELAWCIFSPHGLVYVLQSWPGVLLHVLQSWPGVCVTELAWCTCYRAGLVYVLQNWPGVCVTELAWSTVFQGPGEGGKEGQFVLLFVAMNNGDVVTWKINLPLTGL